MPLLDVAGQSLHVIDEGAGDPILFLHAFPLSGAMWDYQVAAFSPVRRCVVPDLPGFGGSPEPTSPSASMAGWAALVAGALQRLETGPVAVVGASMGGYLAIELLRSHPQLVQRMALVGTRARSDDDATSTRRLEQQAQLRDGGIDAAVLAKGVVEGLLSSRSAARAELVDYVLALAETGTSAGWLAALEAMRTRPDAMYALRRSDVAAQVLVGELDRVTPITESTLLRTLLGGDTELVVVPGAGHLPNLEDPVTFNAALARFLGVALDAAPQAEPTPEPAVPATGD